MKKIIVGTLESSDCMITLSPSDDTKIIIESIVMDAFGKQIHKVIKQTIDQAQLKNVEVYCQDKGALDYAIKARMQVAIDRFKERDNE